MILTDNRIVFNQPDLGPEEMTAMMKIMNSKWIGTGEVSFQFEEEFCKFMGEGYAVAVSSCTIGLQLVLKALDICEGDDVITTPLTFAATLNSIINVGANPILVDVGENGCIDPLKVRSNVTDYTKAVIPVHYSGSIAKTDYKLDKSIHIIEDCAHAFGASFPKSNSQIKVFSFYANKNITCGEGGMVWTLDKKLADNVRILSSQGLSQGAWRRFGPGNKTYSVEKVGLKGNLPDILAAIGLAQLRRWPEMKKKRDRIWNIYEEAFGEKGIGHSTHFYPYRSKNRDLLRKKLSEEGIGTGIHYKPLHLEPAYFHLGCKEGCFPMAEEWGRTELSLPVSPTMYEGDAIRIVETIKSIEKGME